ncbi:MAG: NUDIX domain-containing protein [Nanoarchaeota archaeon]
MTENGQEISKIAIDPVIFTIHLSKLKVLLHVREKEPFADMKELPGGLLLHNETAEESLKRKLKELVGQENLFFKQFYTFTEPNRDPRERTISIGFVSLINEAKIKELVRWFDYDSIKDLAFDHKKILQTARNYLKENVNSSIVKYFMPKLFPLNKLQEVYEILEERKYDNRNFRKKMISSSIVEEMNQLEQNVSHRPAKLFRFK